MTDRIQEFVELARNAICDLADTTAAPDDAANALAALEHSIGGLTGPHHYAANAIARGLWHLANGRLPDGHIDDCLRWAVCAAAAVNYGDAVSVGKNLERGACVCDVLQGEHQRAVQELLRLTLRAVEDAARAMLGGNGVRHAA